MKKALILLMIPISFLIISCTSVPYSQWDSSAEKVVDLINHPGEEYLEEISSNPFLFDGEIIVLDKDISMIWNNLNRSRFGFKNGVIAETVPVGADDYKMFADTMEVKTYFSKYLPEDAAIVKVESDYGLFYLLLGSYKYVFIDKKADIDRPQNIGWFRMQDFQAYMARNGKKVKYPVIYGFRGPVK